MLSKVVIKGGDEKHVNQSFVYTSLEHTLLQLHYDIFFSQICKNLLALFWTKSLELILWFFGCNRFCSIFSMLWSVSVLRNESAATLFKVPELFFLMLHSIFSQGIRASNWRRKSLFLVATGLFISVSLILTSRREKTLHSNYDSLEKMHLLQQQKIVPLHHRKANFTTEFFTK